MEEKQVVKLGHQVEFDLVYRTGKRDRLVLTIVDSSMSDLDSGLLSIASLIAQSILGEEQGCVIPYFTDELEALHIISFSQHPDQTISDPPTRLKESMREILNQIEFRDALLFASSSDTKWGSYDADGMTYQSWTHTDKDFPHDDKT